MNRTITYQIEESDAGIRVEQFLRRRHYSRQNIADLKKCSGSTRLGGSDCRLNARLACGDQLEVQILEPKASGKVSPTELPLSIVYEDADILVVNKPAGLPMHPSHDNFSYSLANAVAWYYRDAGTFVFRCSNRLDRDTSGLTVIAKHPVSASALGAVKKERKYFAIVCGTPSPSAGTIDAPLARKAAGSLFSEETRAPLAGDSFLSGTTKTALTGATFPSPSGAANAPFTEDPILPQLYEGTLPSATSLQLSDTGSTPRNIDFTEHSIGLPKSPIELPEHSIERCVDFAHGERAVTHYQVLETDGRYSLVSFLLETGRTHQIRVHMSYLGYPLAGDYLYNPACRCAARRSRTGISVPVEINGIAHQALHAGRLKFPHPMTGEMMEFTAPIPEDMRCFGFHLDQM